MTQSLAQRLKPRTPDRLAEPSLDDVFVGKDLLELLSAGMYLDPMSIYREYVQNAADAIDEARARGLLAPHEPGRIDIQLTSQGRGIRIRDNGTGLSGADFARTLLSLGGSRKRGTMLRGFRGVGRLAGLAYAQELIFRSRGDGEQEIQELRWDSRRLKAALRDPSFEGGIERMILHCAQVGTIADSDHPERFFEVELKGVIRLRADSLMTAAAVEQYLSQHAPVPFAPEFCFGAEISNAMLAVGVPRPLQIHLDGSERPLYRPHRDTIDLGHGRQVAFTELELHELPDMDGGPAALAWVLHHDYVGAIPQANLIKGLRMRVGDLQVGGNHTLESCFVEQRFNAWSVGEVHVLDKRIVPNARRDDFEQNVHHNNLLNHLGPLAREISRRCRSNSIRRNWLRRLDVALARASETLALGEVSRAEKAVAEAERIIRLPLLADEVLDERRARIAELRQECGDVDRSPLPRDPLDALPAEERRGAERILELIGICLEDEAAAATLVRRIRAQLGGPSAMASLS